MFRGRWEAIAYVNVPFQNYENIENSRKWIKHIKSKELFKCTHSNKEKKSFKRETELK